LTKPLYFYNGTTFEQVGPTTPQSPIAYQTSAPTGPATGDLWIDSDGDVDTYNRQLTRYYFVATAAQTTITGVDANGLTLAYVAGSEAVYVNGALQVRGQDYTATDGTSVVMTSALAVNDVVEIFAYTAFTVANAYTKSETDGLVAAAAGLRMVVPTSVTVGSGSGSVDTNGAVTFSGASSVSLNGCFTSTYDNYKIVINAYNSTRQGCYFRFRNNGTDDSSSNYYNASYYIYMGTSPASSGTVKGSGASAIDLRVLPTTDGSHIVFDVANPMRSVKKSGFFSNSFMESTSDSYYENGGNIFNSTSTFNSFTIYPGANNMTGTVRVYGYKD
jgi:hypothetical protein